MLNTIRQILKTGLLDKLKVHHSLYSVPCTAEFLEELVSTVLAENGHPNDWKPNRNHAPSIDMKLESGESISVKSGEYFPRTNTLKFSGSRLGKHDNITDMINSVIDSSADYYVCVAKVKKEWPSTLGFLDTKKYHLFVFPANLLKYDSTWIRSESGKNHRYDMEIEGMRCTIHSSMSSQLWTWVSTDTVGFPDKLDIILT